MNALRKLLVTLAAFAAVALASAPARAVFQTARRDSHSRRSTA